MTWYPGRDPTYMWLAGHVLETCGGADAGTLDGRGLEGAQPAFRLTQQNARHEKPCPDDRY